MKESVIIKSNKYGINLILDDTLDFEELLIKVKEKFIQSEKFFKGAKVAISFEGRTLNSDEEMQLIDCITSAIQIQIMCIVDQNEQHELEYKKAIDAAAEEAANTRTSDFTTEHIMTGSDQFYRGTLRSGQLLESENSIIVVGDVNPGAKIVSGSNIIVLGALKGIAYAGVPNNEKAFVVALDMDPMQIRIGEVIARSADKSLWTPKRGRKKQPQPEPQAAVVLDGCICIEAITKGFLNNI